MAAAQQRYAGKWARENGTDYVRGTKQNKTKRHARIPTQDIKHSAVVPHGGEQNLSRSENTSCRRHAVRFLVCFHRPCNQPPYTRLGCPARPWSGWSTTYTHPRSTTPPPHFMSSLDLFYCALGWFTTPSRSSLTFIGCCLLTPSRCRFPRHRKKTTTTKQTHPFSTINTGIRTPIFRQLRRLSTG